MRKFLEWFGSLLVVLGLRSAKVEIKAQEDGFCLDPEFIDDGELK